MATGFRKLTVYKKAFALAMDIYHNHIPDKSGIKSINSSVFRLPTADCGLPTYKMQSIRQLANQATNI